MQKTPIVIKIQTLPDNPGIIDLFCIDNGAFVTSDSIEIDFMVYPNARRINSDEYTIEPYEEYLENDSIRYKEILYSGGVFFALAVGILTTILFRYLNINAFVDVFTFGEIAAAVGLSYGSYTFLRPHLEKLLASRTQKRQIAFKEPYYTHILHNEDIFVLEREFARKQRYGSERVLPHAIAFHQSSNSTIMRMYFSKDQYLEDGLVSLNIGSIHFEEAVTKELIEQGYTIAVHCKLGTRHRRGIHKQEYRQLRASNQSGILTNKQKFLPNGCLYSITRSYRNNSRKQYVSKQTIEAQLITI